MTLVYTTTVGSPQRRVDLVTPSQGVERAVIQDLALGPGPTDSLATLAALPTSTLAFGATVFVRSVDDLYYLDPGPETPDGVDVIAALDGGYWVSRQHGRWDDLQGDISEGDGNATLTYEAFRDTPFDMFFMRRDQNDALNFRYQMPHDWDPTTSVSAHLHVVPAADPAVSQNVLFEGVYVWTSVGGAVPALASWTTFSVLLAVPPGGVYLQRIAPLAVIAPPVGAAESIVLLLRVQRSGNNPLDTYDTSKVGGTAAANLGLLSADLHYRKNKIGSLSPFPEG
jgi:hypothetical protein